MDSGAGGIKLVGLRTIYNSVVQSLLLYGSETWVLTPHMVQTLGAFHHRVVHPLMGGNQWQRWDGRCFYPPLDEAIK